MMSPKFFLVFILFSQTTSAVGLSTEYITAPKLIQSENLSTRITKFFLNGHQINHTTQGSLNLGMLYGDSLKINSFYATNRNEDLQLDALYTIKNQVEQSLSTTQVFSSDQQGAYFQFQTATKNQQIVLTQSSPQTMQGMQIQMSFTGACSNLKDTNKTVNSNQQCAFTPSLVTDKTSIDPKFFIPTQIQQFSALGDPISNKTSTILAQPNFQSVGKNGEIVGIDIYTPNVGAIAGNSQSDTSQLSRQTHIKNIPLLGYSRIRKVIKANHKEAVIGLTIHGFGGVWDNDNAEVNFGLSAGAQLLPDVVPDLIGGNEKVDTNINNNLWNAAANIRLPENSWTIYQAAIGGAKHPSLQDGLVEMPAAHFNSFWVGLSPVRRISITSDFEYVATGSEKTLLTTGAEGGKQDNISFVSSSNQQTIDSESELVKDYYIQSYLTEFARDVNFISTTEIDYKTTYYPHLSYSGNLTGSDFVARYYTGLLLANNLKPYLGADYTQQFWQDWRIHGSAIVYLQNSDRDYFSRLDANFSRQFSLWDKTSVTAFSGFRYALNRSGNNNLLNNPINNFVNLGLRLNTTNWLQLEVAYNLGGLLPVSIDSSLSANGQLKINQHVSLSAFLSPYSNQKSYGAFVTLNTQTKPEVSVNLGWQHRQINYGNDPFEHPLKTEHDFWSMNISFNWT